MPGKVAGRGVVFAALGALVLRFDHVEVEQLLLGPTVAGEEGLVGVGGGFTAV